MSGHAKLSPSAASRWLACTPSAVLESEFPNTTSVFAEEGTLAHAISENMLREYTGVVTEEQAKRIHEELIDNPLFNEEMIGYCQEYVDFVISHITDDATVFIEQKLDMTNYIEEGFGTADALVLTQKTLKFFDLKYGKGVRVYAENNKQLMIYALGALNDYGHVFDVEEVHLHIHQPRLDSVSAWQVSVKDLIEWADNELKDKAKLAFVGEGEYVAGAHCHFCRAKVKCRALSEFNMDIAKKDFANPDLLTDDEIAEILVKEPQFTNWIKAVTKFAFDEALGGKEWPGFKLVEGRSNRKYSSEEEVQKALAKEGITDIYKAPAMIGITDMTKKLGKPTFTKIVEPLLIKPPGSPTLVPSSDARKPISKTDDFDDGFQDTEDLV